MKYYILTLSLLFNINYLFSQNNSEIDKSINTCQKAIDAGKEAVATKEFEKAINYFFAAEAYDPARRKEVKALIDDVFDRIQKLREQAEQAEQAAKEALEEAERQKEKAEIEKKRAKESEEKAIKAREATEKEKKKVELQKIEAERQKKIANIATDTANAATKRAIEAGHLALASQKIAEERRNQAERLRIEAISVSAALKSISMQNEYQDTIKGLLAIEAFNMQKTMLEDSTKKDKTWLAPEIYTALHDATTHIRGRHYDEFPKVDTGHVGPIRAIFQAKEKSVYSCGSDGKVILWKIKDWKENGKPVLEKVVIVRQEEKIITTAAIATNEKDGKEIIAMGSRFSTVELLKPKTTDTVKDTKLKKAHKNRSYDYQTLNHDKIKNIYDMAFEGHLLYTLGKDFTIKVYDTKKAKSETLITLKEKAEHIAIHPDGKIIAVGYKNGSIDLFEINKFDKPLSTLKFEKKELKDKQITALTFEQSNKQLAFGTSDGYIGLIPMIGEMYTKDNVTFRKVHSFVVSAIDFKTFVNKRGEKFDMMAVGNYDGTVSIWLLKEFKNRLYEPFLFDDKGTFVTSLEFVNNPSNKNQNQLMVGYFDGTIKFWNMDINSLANDLQCVLEGKFKRGQLSKKEKEDYNLDFEGFILTHLADCK